MCGLGPDNLRADNGKPNVTTWMTVATERRAPIREKDVLDEVRGSCCPHLPTASLLNQAEADIPIMHHLGEDASIFCGLIGGPRVWHHGGLTGRTNPMKSRAERRREARQAQKTGQPQAANAPPTSQRRLAVAIVLMLFFCTSLAVVRGGRLWANIPLWLSVIGWAVMVATALAGLLIWRAERKNFRLKGRWLLLGFVICCGGIGSGYFFAKSIYDVSVALELRELRAKYPDMIRATEQWDHTHWTTQTCQRNLAGHDQMVKDVLYQEAPPSVEAFGLLMAINQVAYIAGCDVDINAQSKPLLDEDKRWRKSAPWQYSVLRQWVNRDGWPRNHVACRWEVERAQLAGKQDVAKRMETLCNQWQADKTSPWNGGDSLKNAEKAIELENRLREREEQKITNKP